MSPGGRLPGQLVSDTIRDPMTMDQTPLDDVQPVPSTSSLDPDIAALVDRELKRCLDHAATGLHWVGPDGTILWANQTELDLLGYSRDEYIGHNIAGFHVDGPAIEDILARLTRGETIVDYDARLRRRDGSIRHVQISSNVLWLGDQFLRTHCFTRDVTDRKIADELAVRLADIVENSNDAVISEDVTGVITSWNPAAERMFGYTAAEAHGRLLLLITPSERHREDEDILRRIRQGERVDTFESVRQRKDGTLIDIAVTASPIKDRSGRIVGASKLVRDISARKRMEARDRFLVELDDAVRPLSEAERITLTAASVLGRHLHVNRCAYATVEDDQDTFLLTGNYTDGVGSIVGRYTFRQFGEECLRLMRAGEPYAVTDSEADSRISEGERSSYRLTAIRSVICVPILKSGRFVAAMAVHASSPRTWHQDEVELVQHVASRCWESIERTRVTKNLLESERQFRDLANSIANLAWMATPDGSIYWYNDQWYAYTGATPADMEGWGWQSVHDPDVLPRVMERWQESIATGKPFEMVFPLRGADGCFRRFLTRVNPVSDSHGRVVHWFGTNTDVENERLATEANVLLREREQSARREAELQRQHLHSLFMQAPTLIAVLRGPDHVVELANALMCEVWGRRQEDVANRPLFDALPELRDQVFKSLLDEVYRSGVPHVGRETPARLNRGAGTLDTVHFNFVYSPFRNVQGDIDGVFVIASDVTAQVAARNQVEHLRESAEAANRAKDEFLAMLGHELRNPLAPILTALQLMKLRGGNALERERTVIERQVTHLTRLVDDLLDVSRIARGKVELKNEIVEMAEVVAKAIELASPLLEERTHVLTVDVPPRGLAVMGDSTRLSQVAANLLTNAAKYTNPGGHITVSAKLEGAEVVLRVRDTGVGIAPEFLPRVFDLFVQERQAIDRAHGGLGLGLTIVRSLVERHGGSVSARSDGPGRGSEFVVRLPSFGGRSKQAIERTPSAAVRAGVGGLRILVVDDNHDAAELLADVLTARGHQTRMAHDAPAALRVAAELNPDVALLDIGLPVMDGYELAARLRELPGLAKVRLIAVTGYGQESDRQKTQLAGFHRHLVKPVDVDAVEASLVATESDGCFRPSR
jgi:PAS domain S-box-containing protein